MKFCKILIIVLQIIILITEIGCENFKCKGNIVNDKLCIFHKTKRELSPVILWSNFINDKHIREDNYSDLKISCNNSTIFTANAFGIVRALNIKNGKEIWSKDISTYKNYFIRYSARLFGGVTVSKNLIYLSSDLAFIYALDSSNGNLIWKTKTLGEATSQPVISGDLLIIHCNNGILHAINKNNGIIKWTISLSSPNITLRGNSSPFVESDTIIIGDDNGAINSISLSDGRLIWRNDISSSNKRNVYNIINGIQMTPIVHNGVVYAFSYQGNITALNFYSGEIIWSKEIKPIGNLLINKNNLYLVDNDNRIISLDIYSGKVCWRQNKLSNLHITSPILYNNNIVVADSEGYLYWIDINSGSLILQKKIDNIGFVVQPIVIKNNLIMKNKDNKIYSIIS